VAELSHEDLNRTALSRQALLQRSDASLPAVLERMGGLQAQYAPSMYIGLWSRTERFTRSRLTAALEDRSVIQGTHQRGTIHLTSREDYWPFVIATRGALREWWLRLKWDGVSLKAIEKTEERVRRAFADRGGEPLHRTELDDVVGRDNRGLVLGISLWLPMVRIPPSGTWDRRRADLYQLAEQWVGPEPALAEAEARAHLARRYIAGFGPTRPHDLKTWAGWIRVSDAKAALEGLDVIEHTGPDGKPLLDLAELEITAGDAPAPVRFLPTWDATLLAHARRTRILPEQYRDRVFHVRVPQSVATFTVGGAVAGSWRREHGHVELTWFAEPTPKEQRAVQAEAELLGALHR
jgi:hypothetical protein